MRARRDRTVRPSAASCVAPTWNNVLDLSADPVAINTYCFLRDCWFPHLLHGEVRIQRNSWELAFTCECGERLVLPLAYACDVGLVDQTVQRSG